MADDPRLNVQSGPFKGRPQQWFTRAEVKRLLGAPERATNHQGEDPREASLAMMIRRLCSRRPDGTSTINDKVREQALELLRSMGLQGSPLRGSDGVATDGGEQP